MKETDTNLNVWRVMQWAPVVCPMWHSLPIAGAAAVGDQCSQTDQHMGLHCSYDSGQGTGGRRKDPR